ncbi:hypothetical protein PR202_gb16095 [Eleusine coracana subsp. coracana]|uniref:Uncharacterized protein n=1 Tax=Eleusine coracana subsp. coracana TaxID=191504 RepID=A0AAV5F0R1_ELECO|nr:hypothetical protein PR202_gb16095 [Eleusine coracana subsp. coracana]
MVRKQNTGRKQSYHVLSVVVVLVDAEEELVALGECAQVARAFWPPHGGGVRPSSSIVMGDTGDSRSSHPATASCPSSKGDTGDSTMASACSVRARSEGVHDFVLTGSRLSSSLWKTPEE